ncbi:response regulator [Desulfoluna sp.]|uniref:response regulator n=1 Tax=Desulfoluna sp. TaxID=2045199 RepID=UPI0026247433|nr:response regulator [Desulfoluna sp.]
MKQLLPKKYSSRLMAITLLAGILPIAIFGVAITFITWDLPSQTRRAIQLGLSDLQKQNEQTLTHIIEKAIRQKSIDVALQIDLYLESHPTLTFADLQKNGRFRSIALQSIEENGYTTLIDTREGTLLLHPRVSLENTPMTNIAKTSNDFLAIVSSSLGGKFACGYFSLLDTSGNERRKYTFIAPVKRPSSDNIPLAVTTVITMDAQSPVFLKAQETSESTSLYLTKHAQNLLHTFKRSILIYMLLGMPVIFILASWASAYFSRAVNQLKYATRQIRKGDFSIHLNDKVSGDIGELMQDFNHMTERLAETTVSKEHLEANEAELTREIKKHERVRTELQKQQKELKKQRDHLHSINEELSRSRQKIQRQNWLNIGQSEFHSSIQGELSLKELGRKTIHFIADYLDAQAGRIYLVAEDHLSCIGSFADATEHLPIAIGEGLVGETALSGTRRRVTDVPASYLPIHSGLIDGFAGEVVIQPCLQSEKTLCVLELATLGPFSKQDLKFLDLINHQVAAAVGSTLTRDKTEGLLHQTQKQAEELTSQQKTLQLINQELEEQTQKLEAQKESIKKKNLGLENAGQLIRQKAKDLEISSTYKSQFLATISHELRTPLNSILLLSHILEENREKTLSCDQVEFAGTIHASGSQLLSLINEILDLSKIEAGGMKVTLASTPLPALVESLRRMFSPQAKEKGLSLSLNLGTEVPSHLKTDRQRLEQILKNLLANALKFTESGSVSLRIDYLKSDDFPRNATLTATSALAFRVTDTGIGVPLDKQDHIFEAFRQVDGTESKPYYGTGLGLTISRELAGLLGGSLHVSSEYGVGSCFTLLLPGNDAPATQNEHALSTNSPAPAPQPMAMAPAPFSGTPRHDATGDPVDLTHETRLIGRKILIVDDDMRNVFALKRLLHEKGLKVVVGRTGVEGLSRLEEIPDIDLVLMDIMMPEMDGHEAMHSIRARDAFTGLPIIALTAKAMPEDRAACIEAGASDYIPKPVDPDKLIEMLRVWLNT